MQMQVQRGSVRALRATRLLRAAAAVLLCVGVPAGTASVASAASPASTPRPGSKWSGSVKGQKYESGSISFTVVKQGKKLYAKGKATLHTACFAVEQGQTLKAGPTRTLSFSGLLANGSFIAKKGTTEDLLHWEIRGSLTKKKLEVRYAEEVEGPPRISCGYNETDTGKLGLKG
jgi:hypothetical protein